MTHPAKYAPPGWVDTGPFEREAEKLAEALRRLMNERVAIDELMPRKVYEIDGTWTRRSALQSANSKKQSTIRKEIRRNERALERAHEINRKREQA